MCSDWRPTGTALVYLMCDQAQRNQHTQQNNPIYRRCHNLLYPCLLRLRRHALQPMMHDLDVNDYNLTAKVRSQHNNLPRDCEGEEHDRGRIVRAEYDEDDECGDGENERDAPREECRIEAGREWARWRGGGKAAEEGRLFFVVGGVDGVTLVVCE